MTNKIDASKDRVSIPVSFLPGFRTTIALQNATERNLLFRTWGGLGDQICAEPTIRYALKNFKDCDISLASEAPELFEHLQFKRVFNIKEEQPIYEKYFLFDTIVPPGDTNLVWQFMSHLLVNCVDFPSLCALRMQLPVADREIELHGDEPSNIRFEDMNRLIAIHAGKHWTSKTFPAEFWDSVLAAIVKRDFIPVLIGANTDDNRGTVGVNPAGCIDLRNKMSVKESIWLLQNVKCLLTNDSSPLHMAASGPAWIGYVATCKHPDMLTHWRRGKWGYRMKNFGRGGMWDISHYCPNREGELSVEHLDQNLLKSWLPDPVEFAEWAVYNTKNGTDH